MRYVVKWDLQLERGWYRGGTSVASCIWDCRGQHNRLPVQVKAQTTEVYEHQFDPILTEITAGYVEGKLQTGISDHDFKIGVLQRLDQIIQKLTRV